MKRVLITADDFGLTKSVSDGILMSHDKGLVSHTGLMVNMPDAQRAAQLAKSRPALSVGLHFNLTQGKPICDSKEIPSLIGKDGNFKKLSLTHPRCAKPSDIEREFRAQIEKFLDFGFPSLHIDGHHYVTFIPSVMRTMIKLNGEYNIASTRMIDKDMIKRGVRKKIIGFSVLCLGPRFITGLTRHIGPWREKLAASGIKFTDYLFSWELFGDKDPKDSLIKTFLSLPKGATEIFGHPGFVDDELRNISTYSDIRQKELEAFTSKEAMSTFMQSRAKLINAYALGGDK